LLGGWWETNPRRLPDNDDSAFGNTLTAGVSYLQRSRHGQFSFSGGGAYRQYYSDSDLNRFNGNAGLGLSQRLSSTTNFLLRDTFDTAYARDQAFLTESGLLLPQVRTLTNRAFIGLTQQLAPLWRAGVNVRHEHVDFDAPELVDGGQLSGSVNFARQVATASTVALSYEVRRSAYVDSPALITHTVSASWAGRLGPRWNAAAAAGASRLVGITWTPYIAADLSARLRNGSLMMRYSRSVSEAYGLGQARVADLFSFNLSRVLSRRFDLVAGYAFGLSSDPQGDAFRFKTHSFSGVLVAKLTRALTLSGAYVWTLQTQGDVGDIRSQGVTFSLAYGRVRQ
jgi:hypothetical protein